MSLVVEVRALTQRFDDVTALDALSVRLEGPGIFGLLGRNGSGKTTLLSLLAGFRKPTAGEALIDGAPVFEDAQRMSQVCLIREGGDTVDGGERVRAALAFASVMRPWWDGEYARRLLDRFNLSPDKKVGQLSRGQRAALACTLGLASRAPLTMFDEAYLGLDAPSRYAFYDELLRDFMEFPRTVIVSTHLIEEVSRLFERVVILDRGRLLLHDEAEALRSRGVTLTGPAPAVDALVGGRELLSERQLGATKSVVVVGEFGREDRAQARAGGVEVEPLPLQDLFVHLTASSGQTGERDTVGAAGDLVEARR